MEDKLAGMLSRGMKRGAIEVTFPSGKVQSCSLLAMVQIQLCACA